MITFKTTEQREILSELHTLKEELQVKAVRSGVTTAIKPLKAAAKVLAPLGETGRLKRAIGHVQVSKRAKQRLGITDTVAVLVGGNRKVDGFLQGGKARYLEYGTKRITARRFLSQAMDQTSSGMEGRFYEGLKKHLDKLKK